MWSKNSTNGLGNIIWVPKLVIKISNAYEFEHVVKCGKLQCPSNILGTMWEMQTFVHKYIPPLSKPFEFFMKSLGAQIMLPSQFVEFLDHIMMLIELLYHKHET